MVRTDIPRLSSDGNDITHTTAATDTYPAVTHNASFGDGCIRADFSQMEYLPWDNPDNIVSAEVEEISRRFKDTSLVFFFLIGGPGNVINMAVFYKQGLKERVNLCLFAVSLADELFLIAGMLFHGEQLHVQFTTGEMFGPIFTFLTNHQLTFLLGFGYVSPVLSAIIAAERCHCVLSPLKYQTIMKTRTMAVIIVAVYLMVMTVCCIVASRYRVGCMYDPESGAILKTAVIGEWYRAHKELVDFLHSFFLGIGLQGAEIVVVTASTIITVVKLHQVVTWRSSTSASNSLSPREAALTKMLVGSSVLFIACMMPEVFTRFVIAFFPEMNSGGRQQNFFLSTLWITQVFIFINSTFNIFVYYVMGSRYRETFWTLFKRTPAAQKDFKADCSRTVPQQ